MRIKKINNNSKFKKLLVSITVVFFILCFTNLRNLQPLTAKNASYYIENDFLINDTTDIGYAEIDSWDTYFGYAKDIIVENQIAFVLTTDFLYIINVSNPSNPIIISKFVGESLGLNNMFKIDNFILLASNNHGLLFLDIGDLRHPKLRATILDGNSVIDVFSEGSYAFAIEPNKLHFIDWSDLNNPEILGSANLGSQARSIFYENYHAFVADYNQGIFLVDMTNPTNMTVSKPFDLFSFKPNDIYIENSTAYVATYITGIIIFDVSDPKNFDYIMNFSLPFNYCYGIEKNDNNLFVACGQDGVSIYDITDIYSPEIESTFNNDVYGDGFVTRTSFNDNALYVADSVNGLQIVNVTLMNNPEIIMQFGRPSMVYDIYNRDNISFVTHSNGLDILNVSEPNDIKLINSYENSGSREIILIDNAAYIAKSGSGIVILNISNLMNPIVNNSILSTKYITDFFLVDDILYIASHNDLIICNISDPFNPDYLAQEFFTDSMIVGVAVKGNTTYLADYDNDLVVLNTTDFNNISEIKEISTGVFGVEDLEILDDLLIAACHRDGFYVFNISDESNPNYCSKEYTGSYGGFTDLYIKNGLVYVTESNRGIKIINVSNPYDLSIVGEFDDEDAGFARAVFVDDSNLIHITDMLDNYEIVGIDSDSEGLADYLETEVYSTFYNFSDSDGDGFNDALEVDYNSDPLNPNSHPNILPDSDEPMLPFWPQFTPSPTPTVEIIGYFLPLTIYVLVFTNFIGLILKKKHRR